MDGLRATTRVLAVALGSSCWAQVTLRANVASNGAQADGRTLECSPSADGRYFVFDSLATNLVPGDTNGVRDIFVRDRVTGITERVSVGPAGVQGDLAAHFGGEITPDGRYVVFSSEATNLVPGDFNAKRDVFLRDRTGGTTERLSVDASGNEADGNSRAPAITDDGRFVLFACDATNLVPGDTNGVEDVFLRDRQTGTTQRVNVGSSGNEANASTSGHGMSADGRYVTFTTAATNLVSGDANGTYDLFLRDLLLGTIERASLGPGGIEGNAGSHGNDHSITSDGRYVVFSSLATNLVPGDTNGWMDVFLRDRQAGTTERISIDSNGNQANHKSLVARIAGDGRYVVFASDASNLVPGDTNADSDVFLRDLQLGTTERASLAWNGTQGDDGSVAARITRDGGCVVFRSHATNLLPGDTNGVNDAYVSDRLAGPSFTSACDPGVGGVIACPCANPPSGVGRGCNNSAGTGGAVLAASGGTFLSSDSLVFTTSGEKPTALSIVSQWNASIATGTVFGMGVRCGAGTLKRLYTKTASGGSITAPDFGAGDLQVSMRSAALGDTIQAGQSRWYLVYYRDPNVLGGCPSTSTFNATQTGQVTWSP